LISRKPKEENGNKEHHSEEVVSEVKTRSENGDGELAGTR